MRLTPQQLNFMETFGFLHFPGLIEDRIEAVIEAFEGVWAGYGGGHDGRPHDGTGRSCIVPFAGQSEYLSSLLDDPRIDGILGSLLGDDYVYLGSDGNYYAGDTAWHSDGGWPRPIIYYKIAFYLDRLTRGRGAIRVIPGSPLRRGLLHSAPHRGRAAHHAAGGGQLRPLPHRLGVRAGHGRHGPAGAHAPPGAAPGQPGPPAGAVGAGAPGAGRTSSADDRRRPQPRLPGAAGAGAGGADAGRRLRGRGGGRESGAARRRPVVRPLAAGFPPLLRGAGGPGGHQTAAVRAIAEAHEGLRVVITHLAHPRIDDEADPELRRRRDEQLALGERPNVWFDFASFPALLGGDQALVLGETARQVYFGDRKGDEG